MGNSRTVTGFRSSRAGPPASVRWMTHPHPAGCRCTPSPRRRASGCARPARRRRSVPRTLPGTRAGLDRRRGMPAQARLLRRCRVLLAVPRAARGCVPQHLRAAADRVPSGHAPAAVKPGASAGQRARNGAPAPRRARDPDARLRGDGVQRQPAGCGCVIHRTESWWSGAGTATR